MVAGPDRIPGPIVAGPEGKAPTRLCRDMTWTGIVRADGMGPETPAVIARGSGGRERVQDGRWIVGAYEQDQFLVDGNRVLT